MQHKTINFSLQAQTTQDHFVGINFANFMQP